MGWRHQLEAVVCAVLLLASMLLVAVRSLVVPSASGNTDVAVSADQARIEDETSHASSRAKTPKLSRLQSRGFPEFTSTRDVGSLWDDGPAYDLSPDGADY
jgi:hypothetical protein